MKMKNFVQIIGEFELGKDFEHKPEIGSLKPISLLYDNLKRKKYKLKKTIWFVKIIPCVLKQWVNLTWLDLLA